MMQTKGQMIMIQEKHMIQTNDHDTGKAHDLNKWTNDHDTGKSYDLIQGTNEHLTGKSHGSIKRTNDHDTRKADDTDKWTKDNDTGKSYDRNNETIYHDARKTNEQNPATSGHSHDPIKTYVQDKEITYDQTRGTNAIKPNSYTNGQQTNGEAEEKAHGQNSNRQNEGTHREDKEKTQAQKNVAKEEYTEDQSLELMDENIYGRDDLINLQSQKETGTQLNSQDSVYGKEDDIQELSKIETFPKLNTQERIQELEYGMDDTFEDSFDLEAARIDLDVYKIEQSGTTINISIKESDESRDSMHIECKTLNERTSTPRKWKNISANSNKKTDSQQKTKPYQNFKIFR